jgi:hypothetical protein
MQSTQREILEKGEESLSPQESFGYFQKLRKSLLSKDDWIHFIEKVIAFLIHRIELLHSHLLITLRVLSLHATDPSVQLKVRRRVLYPLMLFKSAASSALSYLTTFQKKKSNDAAAPFIQVQKIPQIIQSKFTPSLLTNISKFAPAIVLDTIELLVLLSKEVVEVIALLSTSLKSQSFISHFETKRIPLKISSSL